MCIFSNSQLPSQSFGVFFLHPAPRDINYTWPIPVQSLHFCSHSDKCQPLYIIISVITIYFFTVLEGPFCYPFGSTRQRLLPRHTHKEGKSEKTDRSHRYYVASPFPQDPLPCLTLSHCPCSTEVALIPCTSFTPHQNAHSSPQSFRRLLCKEVKLGFQSSFYPQTKLLNLPESQWSPV